MPPQRSGLMLLDRIAAPARHARSGNRDDPLYLERSREKIVLIVLGRRAESARMSRLQG
jgi:hypothetical protein